MGFLPGSERQRQRRHVISDGDGNGRRGMKVTAQEFLLLAHHTRRVGQAWINFRFRQRQGIAGKPPTELTEG